MAGWLAGWRGPAGRPKTPPPPPPLAPPLPPPWLAQLSTELTSGNLRIRFSILFVHTTFSLSLTPRHESWSEIYTFASKEGCIIPSPSACSSSAYMRSSTRCTLFSATSALSKPTILSQWVCMMGVHDVQAQCTMGESPWNIPKNVLDKEHEPILAT